MGMSRSRLKRDREKGASTDRRMSQTIKHLKHSIAVKDRRIAKLEKCLKDFNWLYEQYDFYKEYADQIHECSEKILNDIEDTFKEIKMHSIKNIQLAKIASEYSTKTVKQILTERKNIKIEGDKENE